MRQLVRQSPSSGNRNVEWAISTFRPLLQALHLQEHKSGPTVVKASDYRNLIIKGMGRCVVVVQKQRIRDGQKGYFIFDYKKDVDLFFLSIVLDESLYSDEGLDCKIGRKALGVHEFVHCVAAMMSLSLLGTGKNSLIDGLRKKLKEKVTVTSLGEFERLVAALGTMTENERNRDFSPFNDSHFRTGYEDFPDDYADLYLNFLFSYNLLLEYFPEDVRKEFESLLQGNRPDGLKPFLNTLFNKISNEKALKKEFVLSRFQRFLPRLVMEFLKI